MVDVRRGFVRSSLPSGVLRFPAASASLLYVEDAVAVDAADVKANAQAGMAEAVFFSFTNLHQVSYTTVLVTNLPSGNNIWSLSAGPGQPQRGRPPPPQLARDLGLDRAGRPPRRAGAAGADLAAPPGGRRRGQAHRPHLRLLGPGIEVSIISKLIYTSAYTRDL